MKFLIFLIVSVLGSVAMLTQPAPHSAEGIQPAYSTQAVNFFETNVPINDAFSMLVRNDKSVSMVFQTSDLNPGDAVSVWWMIFNHPSACSEGVCGADDLPQNGGKPEVGASMMRAAAGIVNSKGSVKLTAQLHIGEVTDGFGLGNEGLTDIDGAEIQLVLRTHGPAWNARNLMISYEENCFYTIPAENTCNTVQSSIHHAE